VSAARAAYQLDPVTVVDPGAAQVVSRAWKMPGEVDVPLVAWSLR
jgi:hypothetical protein